MADEVSRRSVVIRKRAAESKLEAEEPPCEVGEGTSRAAARTVCDRYRAVESLCGEMLRNAQAQRRFHTHDP